MEKPTDDQKLVELAERPSEPTQLIDTKTVSTRAAQMYTYKVVPQFYRDHVSKEQEERPTNRRKSTRYTWLTFFPIAFGLQFKKLVNIFYLMTGVLNFFKSISVNSPLAVLVPTIFIMLLGVVKELVSELKRWREDKQVNGTRVTRMAIPAEGKGSAGNSIQWVDTTFADIKVGDILKIEDGEQIPADCILLTVADRKPECFVKTAALDGERNLKPKLANPKISQHFEAMFAPTAQTQNVDLQVSCIEPVKELYYFEGRLNAKLPGQDLQMNLDLNQFLHRGSYIENSGHVICMVAYSGSDTKLIMNLGKYVFKMSSFDTILNRIMVINLLMAIFIAIITAGVYVSWTNDRLDHFYVFEDYEKDGAYFIAFFRIYLIVNSFVPLDLLFMLEVSKMMFTPLMEQDTEMMIPDTTIGDVVGFKANTLNLAEELGQVSYVFCDKTGTLTQNELRFRGLVLQKGQVLRFKDNEDVEKIQEQLQEKQLSGNERSQVEEFFRCVNLCHDCISLKDEKKPEKRIVYNGPSVDEVCLLEMAYDSKISSFLTRDSDNVMIKINGQEESFEILKMFEFTSERKAMSVVLKHPTDPTKAICYVKGADSSVFPMCEGYSSQAKAFNVTSGHANDKIQSVKDEVDAMAKKGLRTLLYGRKEIEWSASRDALDLTVEEVESNLTCLAATAVEDLLQDRVKECIEDFRDAGMSVWMLTGDKGETAREIAVSCGLIPSKEGSEQQLTVMNGLMTEQNAGEGVGSGQSEQNVMTFSDDDTDATQLFEKVKSFRGQTVGLKGYQVLISGMVIAIALDNEFMHAELGQLLVKAQSVVVYRSSPGQKAQVVTFMKKFTQGKVTLAIGDGGNDVNMIQSADLGFGLMGKEGNQAAAFADYAIPRFKDLRRALFWHGRGYGWRIQYFTIMVLIKSIINAIAKFGVTFTNGASGLQPVDDLLITGFNILMTNWFVLHYSVYDQEVSYKDYGTIEKEKNLPFKMAELYAYTRTFINRRRFLKLIVIVNIYSFLSGFVIWFIYWRCDVDGIVNKEGQQFGLYTYGVYMTMAVVISHHLQVVINVRHWGTYLTLWACISISLLPFTLWLSQIVPNSKLLKSTYSIILKSPNIWLMAFVSAAIVVTPLYINKRWMQTMRYPKFYKV